MVYVVLFCSYKQIVLWSVSLLQNSEPSETSKILFLALVISRLLWFMISSLRCCKTIIGSHCL
jgi:hypothetical protein